MADPHDHEYQAAVSGMQDTYGGLSRPTTIVRDGKVVDTYAVGDRIQWLDESGHVLRGVVVDVLTVIPRNTRNCGWRLMRGRCRPFALAEAIAGTSARLTPSLS
ncbi:MAG: hypothetical protein EBR82_77645 [Caulobacteraceae bacterium]|nr:hypothetical protein [Caulobacteraceae bacterium]